MPESGDATEGEVARRIRVAGRVQRVGFRAWTQAEARRLGLRGWVRNEADGAVAVLAAGPRAEVEQLVEALGRGPRLARVASVTQEPAPLPQEPGFDIRR
jgi:acylphosphatase